ncbi:MAG TPA: aquaporin, partial [Longimicrobiales bacterium]
YLYAFEALLLGTFMLSACTFTLLIEHPTLPIRAAIESNLARRAIVGVAMGSTAIALIYSPIGKRSGAHMNPAMTLSFLRLGKIDTRDALGYIAGQCIGGAAGVAIVAAVAHGWVGHPSVHFAATMPGEYGILAAWTGEFVISFLLVAAVLAINKTPRLARYTGCFAGLLVALYITIEAPLSGMSMNPARTFASAIFARVWTGWWIYLTAPVLGMLSAVEMHARLACRPHLLCGRLSHSRRTPSIFKCNCLPRKDDE